MIYKQFDSQFLSSVAFNTFYRSVYNFSKCSVKLQSEKMITLKKLQVACETKPYYGFSKLTLGRHEVICFRLVKNQFAKKDECEKSVLVDLKD